MFRPIYLLLLTLSLSVEVRADRLDSVYRAIDEAIAHSEIYMAKKQQAISRLNGQLAKAADDAGRYGACYSLYGEYAAFQNDSAIVWLRRCSGYAQAMRRPDLLTRCTIMIARQHAKGGAYDDAIHYLRLIPRRELVGDNLTAYYDVMRFLYGEMASYTRDADLKQQYFKIAGCYEDSFMIRLPKNAEPYHAVAEMKRFHKNDYVGALRENNLRMRLVSEGTPEYAVVTYFRSLDYARMGYSEQSKYWLAVSALNDIKNATMDQASLWSLADKLSDEGDIERSYRYVEYSWACTSKFAAHMRAWTVSPVLAKINKVYKDNLKRTTRRLWLLVVISCLLTTVALALYILVAKRRRQLTMVRNELQQSNLQLQQSNTQLEDKNQMLTQLNNDLKMLNVRLSEANQIKEEYIGQFFSLCSDYIEKLNQFRLTVHSKLMSKQYSELMHLTSDPGLKEKDLDELNDNFDAIFLHLFPSFLDDFNALLREDSRISLQEGARLPAVVRIFALIRLGIDDSYHIAQFLHYTPNTVYNYRSRMKAKALDRESFEANVRQIGKLREPFIS